MNLERRFSLDTNILVYAADRDADPSRREASRALVAGAAGRDCLLTLQSLAEFFAATTRKNRLTPEAAAGFVGDWLEVFPVVPNASADLPDAIRAVESQRISFWDAMLWAAVRRAGCSILLTEDFQDGRELRGVRFINPFLEANQDRIATLLA